VAGSWEHGNERTGFIRDEFIDQVSDYQLSKGSPPCN